MESYSKMRERQQKEVDKFPLGFAFNENQFNEMMAKWGLTSDDTDRILSIGAGGFVRKTDRDAMKKMFMRHRKELDEAIKKDEDNFVYEMFCYELRNHEYCITGELNDALFALGLTFEEVKARPKLLKELARAEKACRYEN